MINTKLLGSWGEEQAAAFLRKKRYKILAKSYSCRYGEIDLIVSDREFLVFVEVKLRKSEAFAAAHEYVDRRKQERIKTTAQLYLSENPSELQPRFDVIEVYAPEGVLTKQPRIYHMEDAFQ